MCLMCLSTGAPESKGAPEGKGGRLKAKGGATGNLKHRGASCINTALYVGDLCVKGTAPCGSLYGKV